MDLKLKHKTAFVSASSKGIGFGIASRLAKEGANVILNGRSTESVDNAVQALRTNNHEGSVSGIAADFAKKEEVENLISRLPDLDILVNNVGIFGPSPFEEITDEDWYSFFEINVMSGIRLARHIFPGMLQRNSGRIIFISSESAEFIPAEMIHYGMTKTAIVAVARGLAELTRGTGVTVNSILPGPTKSEGNVDFLNDLAKSEGKTVKEVENDFFKNKRPTSLLQRYAAVEEVADTVAYFASPLSSATNGAAIRVEGGIIRSLF